MDEMLNKYPYMPIVFIMAFTVVLFVALSFFSGWRKLANNYQRMNAFDGKKFIFQSARIGGINYNNCFTFGINNRELYIGMMFPINKLGHPDMVIPLNEITGKEGRGMMLEYVDLTFSGVEKAKIRVSKALADKIERGSNNIWKYKRI